jgi:hypothetical protein
MPLNDEKPPEVTSENVKTEVKHGRRRTQAVAIALDQARKAAAKIPKKRHS